MSVEFDPKEYPHTCLTEECSAPAYNSYGGLQCGDRSYCTNPECDSFDTERLGEQVKEQELEPSGVVIVEQDDSLYTPESTGLRGLRLHPPGRQAWLAKSIGPVAPTNPPEGTSWIDTSDPAKIVLRVYSNGKFHKATELERAEMEARKEEFSVRPAQPMPVVPLEPRYPRAINASHRETLEDYRRWTREHILPMLAKIRAATGLSPEPSLEDAFRQVDAEVGVGIERLKDEETKMREDIYAGLRIPKSVMEDLSQNDYRSATALKQMDEANKGTPTPPRPLLRVSTLITNESQLTDIFGVPRTKKTLEKLYGRKA